jgi:hypothetical protein
MAKRRDDVEMGIDRKRKCSGYQYFHSKITIPIEPTIHIDQKPE